MRNFEPQEVSVFNVASKPFPFRKNLPRKNGVTYRDILKALETPSKRAYIIDDSQYLMAFEELDRARETGYGKFTEMALNFSGLVRFCIHNLPDGVIVYFLHHTEVTDTGKIKAKTVGKMIDSKLTLEGLFSIVLLCEASKEGYRFVTQSDGYTTAKSPMGMFPPEIDNDLKLVDTTIREYWELSPVTDKEDKQNEAH